MAIRLTWKTLLVVCSLILNAQILLSGCKGSGNQITHTWEPKIFLPNPEKVTIERAQADEVIQCDSTAMRKYVCMPEVDLQKIYSRCLDQQAKRAWYEIW